MTSRTAAEAATSAEAYQAQYQCARRQRQAKERRGLSVKKYSCSPQALDNVGRGPAEGSSMNLSAAGSMRKSVMSELCEDRMEHESSRLRLVGGMFVM